MAHNAADQKNLEINDYKGGFVVTNPLLLPPHDSSDHANISKKYSESQTIPNDMTLQHLEDKSTSDKAGPVQNAAPPQNDAHNTNTSPLINWTGGSGSTGEPASVIANIVHMPLAPAITPLYIPKHRMAHYTKK